MIKYHYAFDEKRNVVSIDDIDKDNRHQYKYCCINCRREMISKLGEQKYIILHTKRILCVKVI